MINPAKPRNEDQILVDCLDELGDSAPLDNVEAKRLTREAGFDTARALRNALSLVDAAKGRALQEALRTAKSERMPILKKLENKRTTRTRDETITFIHTAGQSLPQASRPQAFHRNFESATDEDIESLAVEIEVLLATKNDK
ncbi:hypothetical protein [Corallococcus aberystwythensis]|uniref:hypothetical protein n=1 Tax=Corallococcus aberystwythensis TaxID=2316722 RepID=UPI0011C435CF|nr:hypothetical protein [Corallococcus aberystwythensis]